MEKIKDVDDLDPQEKVKKEQFMMKRKSIDIKEFPKSQEILQIDEISENEENEQNENEKSSGKESDVCEDDSKTGLKEGQVDNHCMSKCKEEESVLVKKCDKIEDKDEVVKDSNNCKLNLDKDQQTCSQTNNHQ